MRFDIGSALGSPTGGAGGDQPPERGGDAPARLSLIHYAMGGIVNSEE